MLVISIDSLFSFLFFFNGVYTLALGYIRSHLILNIYAHHVERIDTVHGV